MTPEQRARVRGRLAAELAARAIGAAFAFSAVVAILWKGAAPALALALAAGVFYLARPGPGDGPNE